MKRIYLSFPSAIVFVDDETYNDWKEFCADYDGNLKDMQHFFADGYYTLNRLLESALECVWCFEFYDGAEPMEPTNEETTIDAWRSFNFD